jgi:hypothetical protein
MGRPWAISSFSSLPSKTESERRRHVRARMTIPRQREQKRFDTPIQIAGDDMQDAHQITLVMSRDKSRRL